jgi:hypothetical protein
MFKGSDSGRSFSICFFPSINYNRVIFIINNNFMEGKQKTNETYRVKGEEIVQKVKELIKEGNARRIIIKNEKGETLMEMPLTFGAVGVVVAPMLAAVGAMAALLTNCTIEVERK